MADPSCFVITASDWNSLMLVISIYCVFGPVVWWLITLDWYRLAYLFRVLRRRRRLRAIREVRRG